MKYREIEFKYSADNISLTSFTEFCKSRTPDKFLIASGFDHFYHNVNDKDAFLRHRVGPDSNQLTFKKKTTSQNNYNRKERNLDFAKKMSESDVAGLCEEFGYVYNTSLFKNCFIYFYDYYILVYYICYNTDMKELGRFVEIEMREDYDWDSETHAWDSLVAMERFCKTLGISAQSRIKRSLFELYGK